MEVPAATTAAEAEVDRSIMPEPAVGAKFHLPPIHRGKLSNGMELLVVENHVLPLVSMNLVFRAGRADDPADKPGLAAMTAAMWDEGTKTLSSEEIAARLAGIGASLSISADWDTTSARLFSLKRQLGPALEIYADVLRNPSFPQTEWERQRAAAIGRMTQIRGEPTVLASMAVNQLLFGPDTSYGHPGFGSPKSLQSIRREDIGGFYHYKMQPEAAGLIAVGDVTLEELTSELEKRLGEWRSAAGVFYGSLDAPRRRARRST